MSEIVERLRFKHVHLHNPMALCDASRALAVHGVEAARELLKRGKPI